MNKATVRCSNLALALCLSSAASAVLAKGTGTQALQDQAAVRYDCTSTSQSTTTTAKSPQSVLSHSCVPASPATAPLQPGETAAKTPSRTGGPVR